MSVIPGLRPRLVAVMVMLIVVIAAPAQKPTLYVQTGHEGPINSIAYSPDGQLLASGGEDKTIKLWDVSTKRELRTIRGHDAAVTTVAFDPTGKMVASSSADGTLKVWEAATGHMLWVYGQSTLFLATAFSPDGRYLAAYSNELVLWDVKTWREAKRFKGEPMLSKMGTAFGARNMPFVFSPDTKTVFLLSEGRPKSFDVASGKKLKTFDDYFFSAVAVSPDGRFLAIGKHGYDVITREPFKTRDYGAIAVFDAARGKLVKNWEAHSGSGTRGEVSALKFSPDGRILASAGGDNKIKLWDVAKWSELRTLSGNRDTINSISFSADGKLLASASGSSSVTGFENAIRLWDVQAGVDKGKLGGSASRAYGVAASSDGRRLAYLSSDTRRTVIDTWDLFKGQKTHSFEVPVWLFSVAFSPDDHTLVTGCRDGTAKLWDADTGSLIKAFGPHSDTVFFATFTSDGRRLATTSADKTVKVWDVASGRELRTFEGHSDVVVNAAFSPDGKLLATAGMDKTIRVWNVDSGVQVKSLINPATDLRVAEIAQQTKAMELLLNGQLYGGWMLAFTPDGETLAVSVGGYSAARVQNQNKLVKVENEIRLFDVASGRELRRIVGHKDSIQSLSFSSDGRSLVSGGADRTINTWDVASGRNISSLKGNLDFDTYAIFIPNGKIVAGASRGQLNLWNAPNGELLATMASVENTDEWLVVTPDGLFDGSPDAWRQLLWRFSEKTSDVLSVESYFSEFFYPNLLSDIHAGQRPKAQAQIEAKDRRQPILEIASTETNSAGTNSRTVKIRIEAAEIPPDSTHSAGSGLRDVRLFRNGSLVKAWRGEMLTSDQTKVLLEASVPMVAGENLLSVYAFNRDNVKSEDATLKVTGPENLRRQGTAYVLAVGINSYANSQYNLKYAVADARDFGEEFRQQQIKLGRFANVEIVRLFDREATKANILLALKILAGLETAPLPAGAPSALQSLHSAQPEDAVIICFAGHGTAQQNKFFLVPHDLGYQGSRTQLDRTALDTILAHSISDRELEQAVQEVDAGQLLLIIDACNSGQALEAEEKRRGPMNSKGLAQLAYEKGMYILTAAQSYQAALETPLHGHGYLTFALVEEGLKTANADIDPRDGQVTVREWLDYATQRVPQLQQEDARRPKQASVPVADPTSQPKAQRTPRQPRGRGSKRTQQQQSEQARQFERDKPQAASQVSSEEKFLQQPRVFYRREIEPTPLVVARPN